MLKFRILVLPLTFTTMDLKRPDGRLPTELREIIISFDGLDGVDGSARFGFGWYRIRMKLRVANLSSISLVC